MLNHFQSIFIIIIFANKKWDTPLNNFQLKYLNSVSCNHIINYLIL